jgi:hypothetical protein
MSSAHDLGALERHQAKTIERKCSTALQPLGRPGGVDVGRGRPDGTRPTSHRHTERIVLPRPATALVLQVYRAQVAFRRGSEAGVNGGYGEKSFNNGRDVRSMTDEGMPTTPLRGGVLLHQLGPSGRNHQMTFKRQGH